MNVFWTGGWDSTFRAIDLVVNAGAYVQPHYVAAPDRRSTRHELVAISEIKAALKARFPVASARLLPLQMLLMQDVPPNGHITAKYQLTRNRENRLSFQYEWLNRYVADRDLSGIEIGFQRDDTARIFESLRRNAIPVTDLAGRDSWRLPDEHDDPALDLFAYYTFPLLWTSKTEMRERAAESGFLDLLEMSWFCHLPVGNAPCGCCRVCRYYMAAGLADRFTLLGRFRYRTRVVSYPVVVLMKRPDYVRSRIWPARSVHP